MTAPARPLAYSVRRLHWWERLALLFVRRVWWIDRDPTRGVVGIATKEWRRKLYIVGERP